MLAPILFSMIFTAMLSNALYDDHYMCFGYRCRTDGGLFSASRLQAKTKIEKDWIRGFVFSDDCVLNTATEAKMQQSMNRFAASCRDFGLTISTSKTEVMLQPAPPQPYSESQIIVDGDTLKAFDDFSYLDRTLSTSVNIDSEVDKRIAKAGSTFGRIRASVRDRKGITLNTKLKVYRAAVLPTLSHACEIWTVYECHAKTKNKQKSKQKNHKNTQSLLHQLPQKTLEGKLEG